MLRRLNAFIPGLLLTAAAAGWSQSSEPDLIVVRKYAEIIKKDRSAYRGRILSEDGRKVRLQVLPSRAILEIPKSEIEKLKRDATPQQAFKRLIQLHGGDPEQLVRIAKEALRRFRGLEKDVLKTLEAHAQSGDLRLLELLAQRYLVHEMPAKAEGIAKRLIARRATAAAHLLLGRALAARHKKPEALVEMKKALAKDAGNEQVLIRLAELLRSMGKPGEAQKIFSDALERNPRNAAALVGQGNVRLREGEIAEAALSFTQALEVDKDSAPAKLGLAACKALRKDFDEAYELAEDVLRYENRNARAYGLQGYARLMSGKLDALPQALDKIEESLRENPSDPRILILKAVALNRAAEVDILSGRPQEAAPKRADAEKLLADVEAAHPDDSWLQYLLGDLHLQTGDAEGAYAFFQRAAALTPRYAPAYQAVGAVALRLRKWEEARTAYQQAIRLDPKQAEYQGSLGLALLGMSRLLEAKEVLKKAMELDPRNVSALCGLGYITNAEKNEASARQFFQRALAADGSCAYAAGALQQIFTQRNLRLEYLTFDGENPPDGWQARGGRRVKAQIVQGRLRWRGTQGGAESRKIQYYTALRARDFIRLEADLKIAPDSSATIGLRLGAKSGSAVSWAFEFGKSPDGQIAYRFRDYSGLPPKWYSAGRPWPAEGKVRLALETNDLNSGVLNLFINGENIGSRKLQLHRPRRMSVGVFAQVPARESVDARADNLALLSRHSGEENGGPQAGGLKPPAPKIKK